MSIKGRILAFQIAIMLAVACMAAVAYYDVRSTSYHVGRVQWSRLQLDAVTRLQVRANRYSEQIAELLLVGAPERPDFDSARDDLVDSLAELRRLTLQESDFIEDVAHREEEQIESERLDQMVVLYRQIDRAVERMLLLDQQGRRDQSIALFRSEIENRLDADLEKLIAAAVADEAEEVAKVDAETLRRSQMVMVGIYALLALLAAIAVASGMLLARTLRAPIRQLTEGAQAIARGELDHRIPYTRKDEFGVVAGHFNAMADELRRQRRDLVAARDELERQVASRTSELEAANRQLTDLDQARVRLLADISHELRTPLTILRGEAEVTLRGASKSEPVYRSALANIVDLSASMGRLVDDLLFLARTEADEIRFEFMPVDLPDLVSEAAQEATLLARDRRIGVTVEEADARLVVRGDPRRLKQALLIVLDNAVKYGAPESGIQVSLASADGASAEIRVSDSGPGIDPDEIPRLFERFYRGGNARHASGSGLGLSIARWIVEKHAGSLRLSSRPGVGTEVSIGLPVAT